MYSPKGLQIRYRAKLSSVAMKWNLLEMMNSRNRAYLENPIAVHSQIAFLHNRHSGLNCNYYLVVS